MTLTLEPLLQAAGLDPAEVLVIRHAFVDRAEGGSPGIHALSDDDEVLRYTAHQRVAGTFPKQPPRYWVVFLKEGGDAARLWAVVEMRSELPAEGAYRRFALHPTEHFADLRRRLVIGWHAPRSWWMRGTTAAAHPVLQIADAEPVPFPGFDRLVLTYTELQAVMAEARYASWRTALAAVTGVYLITDTSDGRQYVGKADGAESIRQRWAAYAANGHGGNVELRNLDPATFRFSLLRVFDPATPPSHVSAAESHFKLALDTRSHGLNRN